MHEHPTQARHVGRNPILHLSIPPRMMDRESVPSHTQAACLLSIPPQSKGCSQKCAQASCPVGLGLGMQASTPPNAQAPRPGVLDLSTLSCTPLSYLLLHHHSGVKDPVPSENPALG